MRNLLPLLLALSALAACSAPQYTVMRSNAAPTSSGGSGSTAGLAEWPEVGTWEPKVDAETDVAIVVAIEDYAFLPDVPGAVQNANDWENYFRQARGMSEVYVVTNREASLEEITRFAEQAKTQVGENGTLWFVFIGHGAAVADGSDGALIGMDAQQTMISIQARSLSRKQLITNLEAGPQQKTVVVLDTCFSGRDPAGELLATGTQPVIPVDDAPQITKETVVLSAARNDQVAGQLPGSPRPAFSYLLLGAMRGWADDGDGAVSAEEAITYVSQQMRNLKGRQQTPGLDGRGSIALSRGAGEEDPGVARLMRGEFAEAAPADADLDTTGATGDGDLINTNEGLIFRKPEDWGIGWAGAGVILSLSSTYSGNVIVVSKQNISEAHVGAWISNMNQDPNYIDGRVVEPFSRAEYGPHRGSAGVFAEPNLDEEMEKRHLFATYQNGALYVFELKVRDDGSASEDLEFFKSFIADVRFQ